MTDDSEKAGKRYPNLNKTLEQEKKYYEALGRFVDAFAHLETAMALTLWKVSGVNSAVGPCVFSGVRAKEAGDHIKRILEVVGDKDGHAAFKYLTDQLGDLTSARNDLIHFGASAIGSNEAYVTNELKAHIKERANKFPISPEILEAMRKDANKINFHLTYEWSGREWPKSDLAKGLLQSVLRSSWKYKHQPRTESPKASNARKSPKGRPK